MDSLDISIVIVFLVVTLALGIINSKKIKTIQDYALGGRNFSTGALVATIVATTASASGFFTDLNSTYTDGLFYIIPGLCFSVSLLITAYIFIPRMGEFLGSNSVAEVMGKYMVRKQELLRLLQELLLLWGRLQYNLKLLVI